MAQLIVRNLDDDVRDRLRELANEQGQSVEETVRGILRGAVQAKKRSDVGVGTRLAARFRGQGLSAEIPELRGQAVSPPDFRRSSARDVERPDQRREGRRGASE